MALFPLWMRGDGCFCKKRISAKTKLLWRADWIWSRSRPEPASEPGLTHGNIERDLQWAVHFNPPTIGFAWRAYSDELGVVPFPFLAATWTEIESVRTDLNDQLYSSGYFHRWMMENATTDQPIIGLRWSEMDHQNWTNQSGSRHQILGNVF